MIDNIFNVIGKKNNHTSVYDADRENPTLGLTHNAENSVNLVSGIIRLPSGWDFLSTSESNDGFSLSNYSLQNVFREVLSAFN